MSAYISTATGHTFEVQGAERAKLVGDVVYLFETGNVSKPLGFVKLHPDVVVTFGAQPPPVHNLRVKSTR